ncbi:MAG: hypothetical protein ACT4PV_11120 [Planctomycetaceae bacterium]
MDIPRRLPALLALWALAAVPARGGAELEAIGTGLRAAGRADRDLAETAARARARLDPAGVAALWPGLDLRGRCALVRAIAGAGTRHAAAVAHRWLSAADPEIYAALLAGLVEGGADALFAPLPAETPPARRATIEMIRMRWRTEAELAARKAAHGPTGHYAGQYKNVKELGPGAIPVLFDILLDTDRPIPGEAGAGRYEPIHPDMARFQSEELRHMVANSFAQVVDPQDEATRARLHAIWETYWIVYEHDPSRLFEYEELSPSLSFSLHDLGLEEPAQRYIEELERRLRSQRTRAWNAVRWDLGYAYIRIGRLDEGERMYQMILEDPWIESRSLAAYNLACNFAMRGMQESDPERAEYFRRRAVTYLDQAVRRYQYVDWPWMEEDRDLDFIREDPGYKALLALLQQRYPDRRRVDVSKDRKKILSPPPQEEGLPAEPK